MDIINQKSIVVCLYIQTQLYVHFHAVTVVPKDQQTAESAQLSNVHKANTLQAAVDVNSFQQTISLNHFKKLSLWRVIMKEKEGHGAACF